jgi:hypothetical protein
MALQKDWGNMNEISNKPYNHNYFYCKKLEYVIIKCHTNELLTKRLIQDKEI